MENFEKLNFHNKKPVTAVEMFYLDLPYFGVSNGRQQVLFQVLKCHGKDIYSSSGVATCGFNFCLFWYLNHSRSFTWHSKPNLHNKHLEKIFVSLTIICIGSYKFWQCMPVINLSFVLYVSYPSVLSNQHKCIIIKW